MKILMITNSYFPRIGGVEIAVSNICKEFVKNGHYVEIVTSRFPKNLPTFEWIEGIRVTRIPFRIPNGSLISFIKFIVRAIECISILLWFAVRKKFDIINLHYAGENSLYAAAFSLLTRTPLVTSIHGSDIEQFACRNRFTRWIVGRTLKMSVYIIANSKALLQKASDMFGKDFLHKAIVIGNGVNVEAINKIEAAPRDYQYIIAIGRLNFVKGLDVLIKAFHRAHSFHPKIHLEIVGDGPERSNLELLAREFGIEEFVHFRGCKNNEEAISILKGADFCIVPSRREAFGITILEAMAAEKSVIATNIGGIPEIVINWENGLLVNPEDSISLGKAMLNLIDNPELRNKFGKAGQERVRDKFEWHQISKRYLEVFNKALDFL